MMVAPCSKDMVFSMSDPDAPSETEFEGVALGALRCIYPQYECIVFGGKFRFEGENRKPDLAMIARDRSHWFVVEVELVSHSLERHVLPQIRAFCYGDPQPECAGIISREMKIDLEVARTIIERVPRAVVVIANKRRIEWEQSFRAHQAQFLSVSRFVSRSGQEAFEVDGALLPTKESLGFGVYQAQDSLIRFQANINLPDGSVQIEFAGNGTGVWHVYRDQRHAWLSKETGRPDIRDGAYVQLVRTMDGRISLRL
jgi:hypothetical protein